MRIQTHGISNINFAVSLVTVIVLIRVFVYREKTVSSPMLNLGIFKNADFSMGVIAAMLSFIVGFTSSVMMPYYLINARHLNTSFAGILLIIIPVTLAIVGPVGGILADKYGGEKISAIGLLSLIIAQIMIISFKLTTPFWYFVVMSLLYGIGMGLFQAPNNTVIMTAVDKKFLGVAGSVNSFARNLGMELGASLATVTLYGVMSWKAGKKISDYPVNDNQLFMIGFKAAFVLALVAAIIAETITITRYMKHNLQKNKK
jgi:MFS family permease